MLRTSIILILMMGTSPKLFGQGGLDQRVAELSQQIANEMTEYHKTTIAVVQFTDLDGNTTDLGKYLAEELITCLFQTKKFKVIERQLLNKIIAEQKLSLTGMIDPTSAKQLGKLLGVDAICSGTITDLAQSLRVNGRLISTETGEIFAVASTEVFKDESVVCLMGNESKMNNQTSVQTGFASKTETNYIKNITIKGFTFEIKSVKLSGTTVICDFTIMNDEGDREINLNISNDPNLHSDQASRLIDNVGNEAKAQEGQFGDEKHRWTIRKTLAAQVPMRARLVFENVSATATSIALLEITCFFQSYPTIKAQFRNIPLTK